GASDYVVKTGDMGQHLPRALEIALRGRRLADERQAAQRALQMQLAVSQALSGIAQSLLQGADIAETLKLAAQQAAAITGADSAVVCTYDPDSGAFGDMIRVPEARECRVQAQEAPEHSSGLYEKCLSERQTIVVEDITTDSRASALPDGHVQIRNALFSPIIGQDRPLGVLALANTSGVFTDDDIDIAELFTSHVGMALGHARAESVLQESLRLNEAALAAIPASVLVLDRDMRIIIANERFVNAIGIGTDQLVGARAPDFLPEQFQRDHSAIERLTKVIQHGGSDELIGARLDTPESARFLDISISAFGDRAQDDGTDRRVLITMEDVTERHLLEERLRQAAKMESVGTLASGIAHDFNNILTGIRGFTDMVLAETPEDSQAADDLRRVTGLAERAADLTAQLLAFSRQQSIDAHTMDLGELVADTLRMLERLIGEHIILENEPASGPMHVWADTGQMQQVLINLAVNARDAMPSGGTLAIELRRERHDPAIANAQLALTPGEYVVLSVQDTGVGMDPGTVSRIFEPFFTTKDIGSGTGLGLSTVYGIVTQHGGDIAVRSAPGSGTRFGIYLPHVEDDAGEKLSAESRAPKGTERVLLVEDEQSVRDIAARALQSYGYQVTSAGNAAEALALCERMEEPPELLLTDVVMPETPGPELHAQLAEVYPDLRVAYISGYADEALTGRFSMADGAPIIRKPFTPSTLAAQVRQILDGE
ncbi:MAG TPA: ATP-binding protein, partial [Armatimonadota bacterium]|nr:ATP-binding protein [Armatimonadota bacterium]